MAFDDKNLYFLSFCLDFFFLNVIFLSPIVILINSLWLKATVLPFFPDLWQCCELSPFVIWLLFSYIGPLNSRLAPENVGKYPAGRAPRSTCHSGSETWCMPFFYQHKNKQFQYYTPHLFVCITRSLLQRLYMYLSPIERRHVFL